MYRIAPALLGNSCALSLNSLNKTQRQGPGSTVHWVLAYLDTNMLSTPARRTNHRHRPAAPLIIQIQLDCRSARRTRIINLPTNQTSYDTFETIVGKLSARRIQNFPGYICLGNILKVLLNNFQNNAQTKIDRSDSDSPRRIPQFQGLSPF